MGYVDVCATLLILPLLIHTNVDKPSTYPNKEERISELPSQTLHLFTHGTRQPGIKMKILAGTPPPPPLPSLSVTHTYTHLDKMFAWSLAGFSSSCPWRMSSATLCSCSILRAVTSAKLLSEDR